MSINKPLYAIGDSLTFNAFADSHCSTCGHQFPAQAKVIYAGVHLVDGALQETFALVKPITCPQCQSRIEAFFLPLGTMMCL